MRKLPFSGGGGIESYNNNNNRRQNKRKSSSLESQDQQQSESYKVIKTAPPKKLKTSEVSEEKYLRIQKEKTLLPIYEAKSSLVDEIRKNKTLVVVGETGSGKVNNFIFKMSLQFLDNSYVSYSIINLLIILEIPQYIYESGICGEGCVAITQPRRVAAISIARRVSEEMNVKLGEEVGYTIRFEDVSNPHKTKVKYLTDGMLLRESQIDPLLKKYSVIVLDEAHERTLHTGEFFMKKIIEIILK